MEALTRILRGKTKERFEGNYPTKDVLQDIFAVFIFNTIWRIDYPDDLLESKLRDNPPWAKFADQPPDHVKEYVYKNWKRFYPTALKKIPKSMFSKLENFLKTLSKYEQFDPLAPPASQCLYSVEANVALKWYKTFSLKVTSHRTTWTEEEQDKYSRLISGLCEIWMTNPDASCYYLGSTAQELFETLVEALNYPLLYDVLHDHQDEE